MNHPARRLIGLYVAITIAVLMAPELADAQVIKNRQRSGLGNEIEGAVWQYTATRKGKQGEDKLQGKMRVSGTALFDVPMKRLKAEREIRIGDIINDKDETQLVFNASDKISGRAFVKKEKEQNNDLWVGYFVDKEKARWKFELRKIED